MPPLVLAALCVCSVHGLAGSAAGDGATPSGVTALEQSGFTMTGFDRRRTARTIPSIDPSSVAFDEGSGTLFVADSEIEEDNVARAWNRAGGNLFQASLARDRLYATFDLVRAGHLPRGNDEPTGVAFCAGRSTMFSVNDDQNLLFQYSWRNGRFRLVATHSTEPYADPEGVECDGSGRRVFVVDGSGAIVVYRWTPGSPRLFRRERVLDLRRTAGAPEGIPGDPEGIALDPVGGNLFVVSKPDEAIFEYAIDGAFVRRHPIGDLEPAPVSPEGLTFGPASDGSGNAALYVADGGVDNSTDPTDRDGVIYELRVHREPQ